MAKKHRVSIDEFAGIVEREYGTTVLNRRQIKAVAEKHKVQIPSLVWHNKVARGLFEVRGNVLSSAVAKQPKPVEANREVKRVETTNKPVTSGIQYLRNEEVEYTYTPDPHFVPWGKYSDIEAIVNSGRFFPTFITGLSGNGKTTNVIEAAARNGREVIRVNFTNETCEDDLVGGLRLINGDTVFQYGPVVEAYLRGAILILDEIDVADPNRVLVLQSVLEGKPLFIKKLGKKIEPADGFNVFATANTKGKGSEDGRFIGTNVLNEAFLDRFAITIEYDYPSPSIETKILKKYADDFCSNDSEVDDFIRKIVKWAEVSRKSFKEDIIDELITTRRLIGTLESYFIFNRDVNKVINYAVSRFDDETKQALLDLYSGIDPAFDYKK